MHKKFQNLKKCEVTKVKVFYRFYIKRMLKLMRKRLFTSSSKYDNINKKTEILSRCYNVCKFILLGFSENSS